MKIQRSKIQVLLFHWMLLSVFAAPAFAQERYGSPLTLDQAIGETSAHNPDLAAAQENVRQAEALVKASVTDFLPRISAGADYSASNSRVVTRSNTGLISNSDVQQQFSFGPGFQQNIFSGFRNVGNFKRSQADLDAAKANLTLVKTQISYDLKRAFSNLLFSQEQMKLTESIVPRREQNYKLVDLRFQVGRENKGSLLRSEAQLTQARYDVEQARQNLKVAQAELAKILGSPEKNNLVVKGDFKTKPLPKSPPDFDFIAKNTPTRAQAEANLEGSKANVTVAKSNLFPSLDASAAFGRTRSNWDSDVNRWSAGASLSFPFFNTGRTLFEIQAAKAGERQSQQNLRSTQYSILLDLQQSYADLANALQFTLVQKKFLEASLVRAEIARNQYANGLVTFQDWDLIESDLINSQKSTLSSLNNAVLSEAAWERAQGKGILP